MLKFSPQYVIYLLSLFNGFEHVCSAADLEVYCSFFNTCILMYSQNKGQTDNSFDERTLVLCVLDLFVAGTETTSTTLRWAFLYMAKYPEIQGKRWCFGVRNL